MIRFQTHTGRAFLISDRGFEKKYGYRHGVETPIGDIEENLWCELMKELIEKNGDTALYEQLLEWYRDIPVAGHTKKEREFYVLECFSHKIFDDKGWVIMFHSIRSTDLRSSKAVHNHTVFISSTAG